MASTAGTNAGAGGGSEFFLRTSSCNVPCGTNFSRQSQEGEASPKPEVTKKRGREDAKEVCGGRGGEYLKDHLEGLVFDAKKVDDEVTLHMTVQS